MTKASDNAFPSILITEGIEPSAPAAGKQRLYIDSTTHKLKRTDSSGTDVTIEGGSVATDTIWDAAGDLAVGSGADTAARLAIGTSGYVLTSNGTTATWAAASAGAASFCRAYNSATQSIATGGFTAVNFDTEETDDGGYHFTSAANLTGTVAKTASSAALVGTGTSFTTELTVGQVISVPGTAAEVKVVTVITDNTHLTVNSNYANSASGQTAARLNSPFVAITAGVYRFDWYVFHSTASATGQRAANTFKNGVEVIGNESGVPGSTSVTPFNQGTWTGRLSQWDYLEVRAYQDSGSSRNIGAASDQHSCTAVFTRLGS